MPFQPGQSGNPSGSQGRSKILTEALKRALARAGDGDVHAGANKVATAAVDAAMAGEQWAIKEVWDRLEGKPIQALAGAEGEPALELVLRWASEKS